jgi:hypothetical protein
MNDSLTLDEYDALSQIFKGQKGGRPSACVARNTKRLAGLKYIAYGKTGGLTLTDKGRLTLFVKNCIDGLRAVSTNPAAPLDAEVVTFLAKKGLVTLNASTNTLEMTQRGRESLADIDATAV